MTLFDFLKIVDEDVDYDVCDTVYDISIAIYGFGYYGREPIAAFKYQKVAYKIFQEIEVVKLFNGAYCQMMCDFTKYVRNNIDKLRNVMILVYGDDYKEMPNDEMEYDIIRYIDLLIGGNETEGMCEKVYSML